MHLSAAFSLLSLLASLSTIVVKSEHLRGDGGWKNQLPDDEGARRYLGWTYGGFEYAGVGYCIDDAGNYPDYCMGQNENLNYELSECLQQANEVGGSNILGVEFGSYRHNNQDIRRCNFLYANNDVSSCPPNWELYTSDDSYTTTATEITGAAGNEDWVCFAK